MKILALDLGKFKSVSCFYDTSCTRMEFWALATTPSYLQTLLKKYQPELVVFEACSLAGWVHDLCTKAGCKVLVCNPNQEAWKWKNVKRKTDRDDAVKLAKLAALDQLVPVHIPAIATREHRALVKYRKTIVGRVNRVQNNLRAIFNQHGLRLAAGQTAWTQKGIAEIAGHARPLEECPLEELWRGQVGMELEELTRLREALKQVEAKLTGLAKRDARISLLEQTPGVGRVTAEVIVTCLDNPRRFQNSRQVSAYAGFAPRRWQSGQTDRQGGINRRGSRLLRSALVECAWCALRYNRWARELYHRLCRGQANRKKKAIVAVARKLLVRCWAMLRDHQAWRDPVPVTS